MHRVHTKRGFTLIELLVVIAIIGILATIVIIQLGGAQTRARNSNAKSDVTEMGKAVETWKTTNSTDSTPNAGPYTAAATVINSASTSATLGAGSTQMNAATVTGGFDTLFSKAGGFPVTVSKTPSTSYWYFYITNAPGVGNATMGAATASTYCIGTNVVTGTGGVTDSGFYVNNGSDATSAAAGGGVTSSVGGSNSGICG